MSGTTLVLASGNAKKLAELRTILGDLPMPMDVVPVDAVGGMPDVEETEPDFAGNARLKAEAVLGATGLATLADDSGLEVDALDGAPGVRSARFAGEACDDAANNALLLARLAGVPTAARTARFVCTLCLAAPDAPPRFFRGETEGRILEAPAGHGGFGYDPLFFHPGLGKAFGEATAEEKASVSHRGHALRLLRDALAG